MRWEGLLEFASRQTGFSSSGRIVIVGPIHRKCPEVVVVAVDKIAERCKQDTESLGSDRSRENAEEPTIRAMPLYEVIVVGLGAVGSAATRHLARLGTKVLGIDRYKPPHQFVNGSPTSDHSAKKQPLASFVRSKSSASAKGGFSDDNAAAPKR
jgi:hypothetical protein